MRELDDRMTPLCCDKPYLARELLFLLLDVLGGVNSHQYIVTPHDDNAQEFFSKLKLRFPYDHEIYEFIDVLDEDGNSVNWKETHES